nr:uroporphyrinogen-III synthase [Gemmatimonadales bacterium]
MRRGPVVLTVSPGAFPGLAEGLRSLPVTVEELPLLTFAPPVDWGPMDRALASLSGYGCLAFTSPRAATAFAERYAARWPKTSPADALPPVWSGGPGTTAALAPLDVPVWSASEGETGRVGAAGALA